LDRLPDRKPISFQVGTTHPVFAPPGISDAEKASLETLYKTMVDSASWQELLKTNVWSNEYLNSADFGTELSEVQTQPSRS
jgi:putative tricarboxylic transport membrane protein